MKKIVYLIVLVLLMCCVGSVKVEAASKKSTGYTEYYYKDLYKGQKLPLTVKDDDGKIIKTDESTWKIKSGKKIIKIVDDGQFIKGLKVGTAVITSNISGKPIEVTVEVTKAPKCKDRKVKLGDNSIYIPEDYEVLDLDDDAVICGSVKDSSTVMITKAEEWVGLSDKEINQNVSDNGMVFMGMLLAYYKNNGYVFDIHNMSLAYIDDYICLRLSMDVPEFDMFLNFYAIKTDDMVYEVTSTSFNKYSLKSFDDSLIDLNKKAIGFSEKSGRGKSVEINDDSDDDIVEEKKSEEKKSEAKKVVASGSGKGSKTVSLNGKLKQGVPYRIYFKTDAKNLCKVVGNYDDGETKAYAISGYGSEHYEGMLQEETFLYSILYHDIKVTSLDITSDSDSEWEYTIEEIGMTSDKKLKGNGQGITDATTVKSGNVRFVCYDKGQYDSVIIKVYSTDGKQLGSTFLNQGESSITMKIENMPKNGMDVFFLISAPDTVSWDLTIDK